MLDSLVLGYGEIGSALLKVLSKRTGNLSCGATDIKNSDFETVLSEGCITLHVCIPFSEKFEEYVERYAELSKAEFIIIHSTVQVGTTTSLAKKLNLPVVHSPVQGQHPDLEESILHFTKLIGTSSTEEFTRASTEMSNLTCVKLESSDASELGKLLSTAYYGVCLEWHREMKRICDTLHVDFAAAVTTVNQVYNEGYRKFKPNVIRPVLTPPEGPIGGHCVVSNARVLEQKVDSKFLKFIK